MDIDTFIAGYGVGPRNMWVTCRDFEIYVRLSYRNHPGADSFEQVLDIASLVVRSEPDTIAQKGLVLARFRKWIQCVEGLVKASNLTGIFIENVLNPALRPFYLELGYIPYPIPGDDSSGAPCYIKSIPKE